MNRAAGDCYSPVRRFAERFLTSEKAATAWTRSTSIGRHARQLLQRDRRQGGAREWPTARSAAAEKVVAARTRQRIGDEARPSRHSLRWARRARQGVGRTRAAARSGQPQPALQLRVHAGHRAARPRGRLDLLGPMFETMGPEVLNWTLPIRISIPSATIRASRRCSRPPRRGWRNRRPRSGSSTTDARAARRTGRSNQWSLPDRTGEVEVAAEAPKYRSSS